MYVCMYVCTVGDKIKFPRGVEKLLNGRSDSIVAQSENRLRLRTTLVAGVLSFKVQAH